MVAVLPPLVAERQEPALDAALLLEQLATLQQEYAALWKETGTLRVDNGAPHEGVRELESPLGQLSANSSRAP